MRIAYVGPYLSTRTDSPGLQRALGISNSLVTSGADVMIAGGDHGPDTGITLAPSVFGFSLGEVTLPSASKSRKAAQRVMLGRRTTRWLDSLPSRPDAVIVYGGGGLFAQRVLSWADRANVPVVLDSVEWYDGSHQPMGRFGPVALDYDAGMRFIYHRAGFAICISSMLEQHFASQGCSTLRVPPTLDVSKTRWRGPEDERSGPFTLAYAGSPGKKDLLEVVIRGLQLSDPDGRFCRLNVIGVSAPELSSLMNSHVPKSVVAHGRLPRSAALDLVSDADCTVLVRPDKRFANAGFPTKVVESLAVGTPVMCNYTSDLADHIQDGINGWVIPDSCPLGVANTITRALATSPNERRLMRSHARLTAETSFDYRVRSAELAAFMDRVTTSRPARS